MSVHGEQALKKVVAELWAGESTEMEMVLIATPTPSAAAYSDKIEKMLLYGSQPWDPLLPLRFGMVSRNLQFLKVTMVWGAGAGNHQSLLPPFFCRCNCPLHPLKYPFLGVFFMITSETFHGILLLNTCFHKNDCFIVPLSSWNPQRATKY